MRALPRVFLLSILALSFGLGVDADAAERTKKKWALLVFINGFNNLDYFGAKDINEMETVGSTDDIHVVAQWASLRTREVNRVYVQKDNDTSVVSSPIVGRLGTVDMGDYRNLVEFVKWAHANYPAERYFIDVWNHGSGWHRKKSGEIVRDISSDDLSGNSISTEQLGVAMNEISAHIGSKVALYGSDACLMGMIEIAAEMKNSVEVYLGSQHLEPGDGWPYGKLLEGWSKIADPSAEDVAKVLTTVYKASYPGRSEITLSAYRMSEYDRVASSLKDLAARISDGTTESSAAVKAAATGTTDFFSSDYKDLGQFLSRLSQSDVREGVRSSASVARQNLSNFVVANVFSSDLPNASGVSVWIPNSSVNYDQHSDRYRALAYQVDSDWQRIAELIAK